MYAYENKWVLARSISTLKMGKTCQSSSIVYILFSHLIGTKFISLSLIKINISNLMAQLDRLQKSFEELKVFTILNKLAKNVDNLQPIRCLYV